MCIQLDRIIRFSERSTNDEENVWSLESGPANTSRKISVDRTERTFGVKIFLARCARSLGRSAATTRVTIKSIYHQTYVIAKRSLFAARERQVAMEAHRERQQYK